MYVELDYLKIKNTSSDFRFFQEKIQNIENRVKHVQEQFQRRSYSSYMLGEKILGQRENLEYIIKKLALLEDGIERATELYLHCENQLMERVGEAFPEDASGSEKNEKTFWDIIKDYFADWGFGNSDKAKRVRNDKVMAKELKELIKSERYSKNSWKQATVEEREQILRELYKEMQSIYGVSLEGIFFEVIEAEPGYITYGYFRNSMNTITINKSLLEDVGYYEKIIDTMAHEMRHSYQWAVINDPDSYQVDQETVEIWRDNFNDYKTTEDDGYNAYREQPIERDARRFAAWVI